MADEETYNEFSGEEVHHHYHPQGPKRHHYPIHHTRIPADHLESHGNSKLWNDPDWGPMDAEATVPGLSAIGRGPKGDSISATVTSDDDSFVITIYDTDTGEVIGESSNLSAGYITAHQASVTPQPGKATTAYIDVHRGGEVHSYEIKINPGAPGTRVFILPDGVKQRSNRPAETTYACESEELQVYNMPKFKNAPAPRPGDLVMCILEFLDGSYALAIGTVMSNDHHRVIFLVRTILPTRTPHIENVDGVDWWFIGDVNTNVPATAGDIRDITIEMIGDEEEPYAYAEKNSEDHTVSLYFFLPKSHEYKAGENLELEDYTFDIKEEYTNSVLSQALEAAGNLYSGGDGISIDSDHVVSADETLAHSDDVDAAITEASDKLQSEIDNLQNTVDTLEDKDTTYTAGDYIEITGEENAISAELAVKAANEYTDSKVAESKNSDTTYTAGDYIEITGDENAISASPAVAAANEYTDTKAEELQEEIENFNPGEIYTAGDMIEIADNVISVAKTVNMLFNNVYEGRNIEEIPEIQEELEEYGSVPAFLQARAQNLDSSYLNIGDWVEINNTYMGSWKYAIYAFWPYLNAGNDDAIFSGHITMGPLDTAFETTTQWSSGSSGNNNGTSSQPCPYAGSQLHKFELETILPTFPTAWQNVMMEPEILLEERYSSSGSLTASNNWSWVNVGKIWSPSEVEVEGFLNAGGFYSGGFDCQFPFFKTTSHRVFFSQAEERVNWWLRTVRNGNATYACYVHYRGYGSQTNTTSSYRVVPCFHVA